MKKTGDEYFDSEEFLNLLSDYEKSINTGQPVFMDADELAEIADYYQLQGRQDEAEVAITHALSLSPGAIAPLTYRIHEAIFQGDTLKAWQYLDQIIEKSDPDYVYDRGEILIAEGRIDEADNYFREEFKKVDPQEYQDYVVDVASIYSDYNINEKAMEWLNRSKPESSTEFKELMARTLFGLGKYKDSEKLFNELIDTDPFQKRYWASLASAQFMNEDYSGSIESSEYAIAIDPEDPDALLAKANGLFRLGNFEQAVDYYHRYLQQVPNDEFSILNLGTCLINIEKREEAIETFKHALEVAPAHSPLLPDIYQELALASSEKGEIDQAIDWMNKTDELDCDHIQTLVVKGHIYLSAGMLKEAELQFREAVLNTTTPTKTLLRIIVSLYDNKYLEASYKMLLKFFRFAEDDNIDGYAYMALCCHDLRRWDEYLKYLKIACELNHNECQMVLNHLFPEDLAPEKYYEYTQERMKQ